MPRVATNRTQNPTTQPMFSILTAPIKTGTEDKTGTLEHNMYMLQKFWIPLALFFGFGIAVYYAFIKE